MSFGLAAESQEAEAPVRTSKGAEHAVGSGVYPCHQSLLTGELRGVVARPPGHQFQSPAIRSSAGPITMRTSVASINTATASVNPIIFTTRKLPKVNAANTTIMIGVTKNGIQPRIGLSYLVPGTGTVLRLAYSRTFETPFNENLLLSSATGTGVWRRMSLAPTPASR
jgi:hypothetical protein